MVLAAVVAAAAIAGSLSLSRKMILRVPKELGDEDEEVTRLPGLFIRLRRRPRLRAVTPA